MRTSLTAVLSPVLALSLAGCSEDDPDETRAPDPAGPAFAIALPDLTIETDTIGFYAG